MEASPRRRRRLLDESAAVGSDFAPRGGRTLLDDDEPSDSGEPEPYGDRHFAVQPTAPELLGSPQGSASRDAGRSLAQLPTAGVTAGTKRGREPPQKPKRYYPPSSSPPGRGGERRKNYLEGGSSQRSRRNEYEDVGESEASDEDQGFSHAAVDAALERATEAQSRVRGLRVAAALRRNPDSLPLEKIMDFYMRFLVAGLVLPDGGASILRDMPGSPDAHLWKAVSRRVEGDLASLANGFASSMAWSPGTRAAIELLPFFEFEEAGGVGGCEICRRRDHTASFLVRLHGPAINSAGLNAFGMTAATDWASGSTSSAAVGTGISSFWADHIPRGSHAAYSQEFRSGAFCRQRLQAYGALRHFKYRLLCAISAWIRAELEWPAVPPGFEPSSEPPPWYSGLLQSHMQQQQNPRPGASSEYDYLGEEESAASRSGSRGSTDVDAIRVAIDFLDGRRAYRRRYPRGHDSFPGGHETKAIVALNTMNVKVARFSRKLRGESFWRQFFDVGPIIGEEIASFFAEHNLVNAFAEGRNCAHLYGRHGRTPNWTKDGPRFVHTPNAVSRMATTWGADDATDAAGSGAEEHDSEAPRGSSVSVSGRARDEEDRVDAAVPSALLFAYSSTRRNFLASLPGNMRVLAQDRLLALGLLHQAEEPRDAESGDSDDDSRSPSASFSGVRAHVAPARSSLSDEDAPSSSVRRAGGGVAASAVIIIGSSDDESAPLRELESARASVQAGRSTSRVRAATDAAEGHQHGFATSGADSPRSPLASSASAAARDGGYRTPWGRRARVASSYDDVSDDDAPRSNVRRPAGAAAASAYTEAELGSSSDESVPLQSFMTKSSAAPVRGTPLAAAAASSVASPRPRDINARASNVQPAVSHVRPARAPVPADSSDDDIPLNCLGRPGGVAASAECAKPHGGSASSSDDSIPLRLLSAQLKGDASRRPPPASPPRGASHRTPLSGLRAHSPSAIGSDDDAPRSSVRRSASGVGVAASAAAFAEAELESSSGDDSVPLHTLHAQARVSSSSRTLPGATAAAAKVPAVVELSSDSDCAGVSNVVHRASARGAPPSPAAASPAGPRVQSVRAASATATPVALSARAASLRFPPPSASAGTAASPRLARRPAEHSGSMQASSQRVRSGGQRGPPPRRPRSSAESPRRAARPRRAADALSPVVLASLADVQPLPAPDTLPRTPDWRGVVLPLFQSGAWRALVRRHCGRLDSLRSYAGIFASGDHASARREEGARAAEDADLSFLASPPGAERTEVLVLTRSQRRRLISQAAAHYEVAAPAAAAMAEGSDSSEPAIDSDADGDEDEFDDAGDEGGGSNSDSDDEEESGGSDDDDDDEEEEGEEEGDEGSVV